MLTKFKELMRKPVTFGDLVQFYLGAWIVYALAALGMLGKLKIDEMRRKKTKNEKKGYTKIKLDDLPDDDNIEVEEVFSWD